MAGILCFILVADSLGSPMFCRWHYNCVRNAYIAFDLVLALIISLFLALYNSLNKTILLIHDFTHCVVFLNI